MSSKKNSINLILFIFHVPNTTVLLFTVKPFRNLSFPLSTQSHLGLLCAWSSTHTVAVLHHGTLSTDIKDISNREMANFKHSNFASSTFSNLSLQKNYTVMQLTSPIMYWGQISQRDTMFYPIEWWNLCYALCMNIL